VTAAEKTKREAAAAQAAETEVQQLHETPNCTHTLYHFFFLLLPLFHSPTSNLLLLLLFIF
jgi:hypothetical protein